MSPEQRRELYLSSHWSGVITWTTRDGFGCIPPDGTLGYFTSLSRTVPDCDIVPITGNRNFLKASPFRILG